MLKILILCLAFNFVSVAKATGDKGFDDTPSLNEQIVQGLVGLYEAVDKEGRKIFLLILKNEEEDILEMHQSIEGEVTTILQMPLLLADMTSQNATSPKIYTREADKITVTVIDHSILAPNKFLMRTQSTFGKTRVTKLREFTFVNQGLLGLLQTVNVDYARKTLFGWASRKHTKVTFHFTKISTSPISLNRFVEDAIKEKQRIKREQNIEALTKNDEIKPTEIRQLLEFDEGPIAAPTPRPAAVQVETPVSKEKDEVKGQVIPWQVPEKSSFNFLPPDHNARIISYERFKEYQEEKRCDQILAGKIGR